jgi:hypothetical protein
MQQVMAEVQRSGVLDQASQERLMQDLRQTDPSLWPQVVQSFRATMAYRQEALGRRLARGSADQGTLGATVAGPQTSDPAAAGQAATRAAQGPAAHDIPPGSTSTAASPAAGATAAGTADPAHSGSASVAAASYSAAVPDDWQAHLAAAIRLREAELRGPAKTPDDGARQAQLRMLYLLAGRREDAMQPITAAPAATQAFWSSELYGLAAYLDAERTPDAMRRAAEAKQHLSEALVQISESCPLVIRNLALCTDIQSFGRIKAFDKYDFSPGQALALYAELENLSNESSARGYHTVVQSNYQIFDNRGQRVADAEFTPCEEYCRNPRRDYYMSYEVRLPERMYPGKHTLQLTIIDQIGHKTGQSTIEFTVKDR